MGSNDLTKLEYNFLFMFLHHETKIRTKVQFRNTDDTVTYAFDDVKEFAVKCDKMFSFNSNFFFFFF